MCVLKRKELDIKLSRAKRLEILEILYHKIMFIISITEYVFQPLTNKFVNSNLNFW